MATDVARLAVVVEADTAGAERGLANLHQQVSGLGALFQGGAAAGAGFGVALAGINAAIGGLSSVFGAVSGAAIGFNNTLQQSSIAFTTMLGSAQAAGAFLQQLQQFANTTPFEFPELVTASQRMLAMGFAAKDVVPLLTDVGNAASALGAGKEGIDRVTTALGQMNARTRVSAEEMNQLTEAGIPAWRILADAVGKPIPVVQKLAEQGQIASDVFINAFDKFARANWGDMMEKQSHTFEGAMSTIKDVTRSTIAGAFEPFFNVLTKGADTVAQFLQSDAFGAWAQVAKGAVQSVVDSLAPIGAAFSTVFAQLTKGDFSGALGTIVEAVKGAVTGAVDAVNSFGQAMFGAGWTLMTTLAGGIIQGANQAISAAIQVVADMIASFFVGSSPPPAGPLSEIDRAGQRLIETYGEGMKAGLGPVRAAAEAVNEQFMRSDLTDALQSMTDRFEASKGHLEEMKAAGGDVEAAIKAIDREVRDLDRDAGAVKYTVDTIKDAFEDQIRPLERQLTLLRGVHDFGRDEKQIAFEERDIAIRRQEIDARGNKQKEEAARKAREQFSIEKELYDIGNRQKDLAEKRAEIPLLQQIDQLKQAQDAATQPLTDQLRILERQKAELGFQKTAWTDLKATIADAVAAATPKGGGGGGGGGGALGKLGGAAGGGINLADSIKTSVDKGVDDLKAKFLKKGDELAESLTKGITSFFREKAPTLIGVAAGALIGGAALGPVGFALGAVVGGKFGEGLTTELQKRGIKWDQVMTELQHGAERVTTLLGSLFSGDTLATAVNKAFGDVIPASLNRVLDQVDQAFRGNVGPLLATIGDTLATALPVVVAQVEKWGAALVDWVGPKIPPLLAALGDLGGQFLNWIGQQADGILAQLGKWAEQFGAWVGPATVSFLKAWPGILNGLLDSIETSAPGILEKLGTWALQFAAWVGPALPGIALALAEIAAAVTVFVAETAVTIALRLAKWGLAFVDWVATDALPSLPGELAKIAAAVATWVADAAPGVAAEAGKIGQALIDGLGAKLSAGFAEIGRRIAAYAASLPDYIKGPLGIHSPSQVMIDIGENIVAGLRIGILTSLDSLPAAFQRMTQLFRAAAQSLKAPIDDLIGRFYQGVTSMGKDVATGYFAGFLRSNNIETSRHLADALRGYLDEYLDKLGTLADDAVPAVQRVQEDLAQGLSDAVAQATKTAADAVAQAASQIQDAIASLAESRDIRGRRSAFASGQSAVADQRRQQREDAEAQYQLDKELAKATSDEQRAQILARFKDAEEERAHRRQLDAEDRAFQAQQAAEQQAFEDGLADEALAKQIARIQTERDARLAAVRDELAAREAGLVKTAQTALVRIVQDLNDQLNKSLGAFFDNLPEEMRKRGGPTDPGFLGAVRNDVSGLLVPIVGMLQSFFANMAGIPNDYGPGVSLPAIPPGGSFHLPALPAATPAPAPPVVINVAGSVWSLSELASAIRPELARVITT